MKTTIKSVVIVGGGTSGWMTAAALSHHFAQSKVSVKVIDSTEIGTIGVGEATIPTLRRFYQTLGLTDQDVLTACQATCKLGIEFKDWYQAGSSFIHPFGLFGQAANGVPFHHYWLKLKQNGDPSPLSDYSYGVRLAQKNKFTLPVNNPNSPLAIFDWALHFDASLFAELMKKVAIKHGCEHIDNTITSVNLDAQQEAIDSVTLKNGQCVTADLFIDCSGFKALLIEGALKAGYQNWSQWLKCDRAVAVQTTRVDEPLSRTVVQAREAGWQWTIPLQNRSGNGHVYSSQYMSQDEATALLLEHVKGEVLQPPRHFSFTPGRRTQAWKSNCIAVGLAAGFLEPLESTSIALVETAIDKIIQTFSSPEYTKQDVERFNHVTATEYERVRDFLIVHYALNQREQGQMWQDCREMTLPRSLSDKLHQYQTNGALTRLPWEMFGPDSWLAIFDGFACYPQSYDPLVDKLSVDYLAESFKLMRDGISDAVAHAPTHSEFLRQMTHFQSHQPEPA
ncbi:tryptophan halogenase family protein [Pseudoalteromonas ulvae]|uniref:Tryptophan halogenase n=1 Tax=Pseudoalteromonas ulvae TaxID=107327 RepID=A0A244CTI4_PSEDV|nr:tryptophan halogenase family protein [Pseudoalteromonas ulvae]OUL58917.1 tryptophan halogenase [Pseudoalteromonas ulvae]